MARLWAGAEPEEDRIKREEQEGIRPEVEPVEPETITPRMALVDEGLVVDVLTDVHRDPDCEAGVTAVAVDTLSDLVVGASVPWPRLKRDELLAACDWTQQPDLQSQKPWEWRAAWAEYRQALRDLPETFPDPLAIKWPQTPHLT